MTQVFNHEPEFKMPSPTELAHARHARHEGLITPELRRSTVFIVGTGMLGSFTALALAKTGCMVHVWDHDIVDTPNLGNQIFIAEQLGRPKVEALRNFTDGIFASPAKFPTGFDPEHNSGMRWSRPERPHDAPLIMISAVDSFAVRKELAQYAFDHGFNLFLDTRAMGEIAVTCTVPHALLERFIHELPSDASAPDAPCGFEGAAFTGLFVGARTVAQLNAFFRGFPVPYLLTEDLSNGSELSIERLRGGDCWTPLAALQPTLEQPELPTTTPTPA